MDKWEIPDWIYHDLWQEFEEHRKEIKKPLTDRARAIAAKKLRGLSRKQQQAVIELSIECRWTGLFPEAIKQKKGNGSGTPEDVCRAYQAEFGKPPPPGKTTDEVRAMISQKRDKQTTWWNS